VNGFSVEPAQLQGTDAALGTAAAQSRAALGQLRTGAAQLLGARWQGSAAAAFRLGWEQWLEGADAMLRALDDMAQLLGASGRGYTETDDGVRASMVAR
jgi:WXG100 family type VII secretion target